MFLFNCEVVCDSLRSRELKHARLLLSFTISWSLFKVFMSTESVRPSNHLILCRPLLLLPSIFSSIRVFSNELALHMRWPKYGSFSFSICPSNEYSGLISFRIDWFDLLVVQGLSNIQMLKIYTIHVVFKWRPWLTSRKRNLMCAAMHSLMGSINEVLGNSLWRFLFLLHNMTSGKFKHST